MQMLSSIVNRNTLHEINDTAEKGNASRFLSLYLGTSETNENHNLAEGCVCVLYIMVLLKVHHSSALCR